MPLLDHFGPPLHTLRTWTAFLHTWACHLLDYLDEHLHEEFRGCPLIQVGGYPNLMTGEPNERDRFESQVYVGDKEWKLPSRMCAVVKFVSPRDKADAAARRAFAEWCHKDLQDGLSLIVVDIVTTTRADMHAELCEVARLGIGEPESEFELLAASFPAGAGGRRADRGLGRAARARPSAADVAAVDRRRSCRSRRFGRQL